MHDASLPQTPQLSEHERALRASMLGIALGLLLRWVSRRSTV